MRNETENIRAKSFYTQALAEFRKMGDSTNSRIILPRLEELETSPGVKVVEIKKGGIADRAGVVAGDIIIGYRGNRLSGNSLQEAGG